MKSLPTSAITMLQWHVSVHKQVLPSEASIGTFYFPMETDLRFLWFITWCMIVYQIYKKVSSDRQQRVSATVAPMAESGVWTSAPSEMTETISMP